MASEDYQKLSLEAMSLESTNTFVLFPCMVGPPQELGGNNTGCLAGAQGAMIRVRLWPLSVIKIRPILISIYENANITPTSRRLTQKKWFIPAALLIDLIFHGG